MPHLHPVSIGNIFLDVLNYRHGKQPSQKAALMAIIEDQGLKLAVLAKDIIDNGLNPSDLPILIDAEDGSQNYIVVEGNRRAAAIKLMLDPEQAAGTKVHKKFAQLHKEHSGDIPKVIQCVIAQSRDSARVWIDRKHASNLGGAGTEEWSSIAKARADVEAGILRPDLDVVQFVLSSPNISEELRHHLEGSSFNLTTLERMVLSKVMQDRAGYQVEDKRIIASSDKEWLIDLFSKIIETIYRGKYTFGPNEGSKFTERKIDTDEHRQEFVDEVIVANGNKKKAKRPWTVSGSPSDVSQKTKTAPKPHVKTDPTTEDRKHLIPRKTRISVVAGKSANIFDELKHLNATEHRYAVSVLFRVFVELSLDAFIKATGHTMPANKDSLRHKFLYTIQYLENNQRMTAKELAAIKTDMADKNSLISPVTMNAYVHSEWMNPDPLRLKITWDNLQVFIENIWAYTYEKVNEK